MNNTHIIVFGEDPRQHYLCCELQAIGYSGKHYPKGASAELAIPDDVQCIIFPLFPQIRLLSHIIDYCKPHTILCAGLPSQEFLSFANAYGFSVYDYMSDPEITQLNAVATAEGAIAEGLHLSKMNLQGSNTLVIGYGACGEILAGKCRALGSNVIICDYDRSKSIHARAHGLSAVETIQDLSIFSYIFNTAPTPVLTETLLKTMRPYSVIIDIASSPGGTDFDYCKAHNITAKLCPSLPAIYAPRSSGIILARAIHHHLTCRTS